MHITPARVDGRIILPYPACHWTTRRWYGYLSSVLYATVGWVPYYFTRMWCKYLSVSDYIISLCHLDCLYPVMYASYLSLGATGLPEGGVDAVSEPEGLALVAGDGQVPNDLVPVHHHGATTHLLLTASGSKQNRTLNTAHWSVGEDH